MYTEFFQNLISRSYPHEIILELSWLNKTSWTGPTWLWNLNGLACGLKLQTWTNPSEEADATCFLNIPKDYMSEEKSIALIVFSCPLKHLTKLGSCDVATVLISPLASSIFKIRIINQLQRHNQIFSLMCLNE